MTVHPHTVDADLVPLVERMRWMRYFRLAMALVAVATMLLLPELVRGAPSAVAATVAAYVTLAILGEAVRRRATNRGLLLFGVLNVLDGLFLALVAYGLTDPAGPLRYLIVFHVVCVTLLASFRTGIKLALWHSLLITNLFYAQEAGLLEGLGVDAEPLGGLEYRTLIASIAVFWLAAIATASFAAVNERELRRRRVDLESLASFAARLEAALEPADVAEALTDAVEEAFEFERIVLFAAPSGDLQLLDQRGASIPGPTLDEPGTLLRRAQGHETLLVSRFAEKDDPWLAGLLPGATNLVLVPLHADGRTIGVVVCEHGMRRGSRIERRVVSMLERFASQAALALVNAWLMERLQRSAATDGLTGLANRTMFDQVLGRELARAQRGSEPVSVVLADVDRFKQLNDRLGHLAGDEALRRVAQTLAGHGRASDLVARFGGEEFAIVLPSTSAEAALVVAERMRVAVANTTAVTASFGVATFPAHGGDGESLISAADAALYASKNAGRDRVTAADEATPQAPARLNR